MLYNVPTSGPHTSCSDSCFWSPLSISLQCCSVVCKTVNNNCAQPSLSGICSPNYTSGETEGPYTIIASKHFNRFTSRRPKAQAHHLSFVQLEALAPNCRFSCRTPLHQNTLAVPSKGLMERARNSTLLFTCEPKSPSLLLETTTSALFVCKALG